MTILHSNTRHFSNRDIAGEISRGLRLKLAPRDETVLAKRHTDSAEAYRLYLLSRQELSKSGPVARRKALEYASQATERDPNYAPAYVALADVYNTSADTAQLPHREAYSAAKKAATKALEIDEALPEGHTALAYAVLGLDWDWSGAERGLKRALELNPSSALAHGRYGDYLNFMGSSQEAIAHKKRAMELDPLSLERHLSLVFACYLGRQYDRARGELLEAVERNPNVGEDAWAWFSAVIHRDAGMYDNAIAEFRGYLDRQPDSAVELGHLGNTYARAGRVREARECLRKLKELVRDDRVGVYEIALIHAGLGEKDQAFEWLERAYEERYGGMRYLKVDPSLDPLRSDPRFEDLLRRMDFPE